MWFFSASFFFVQKKNERAHRTHSFNLLEVYMSQPVVQTPQQTTHSIDFSEAIGNGISVAVCAVIIGTNPVTALILGSVHALVDQVTKPFFQGRGGFFQTLFNMAATTGIVNTFSATPIKIGKVVYNVATVPLITSVLISAISLVVSLALSFTLHLFM